MDKILFFKKIDLIFSESKNRFQKKAKSKEFLYSPERPRRAISKPNYVKGIPLLTRNLKLNYPRKYDSQIAIKF